MAELNPVVHDAIVDDAEEAMAIVGELTRAERLGAHYTPDNNGKQLSSGRVIHPVAMIKTIFHNLEVAMSKATKEERMDKGREWIPYNEHLRRAEAIMNSNATPEVKQRKMDDLTGTTWFIDYPHIHNTYLNQKRQRGKAISERYSKFSTPPAPPAAPVAPPPPVPTPTPKPSAKADLPRSPSTATGSDTADNSGKSKTEGEKFDEKFAAKAF
jgi:hypothetical protein